MKTHILLVDDDSDELEILSAALQNIGIDHKCTWAHGVTHALRIMQHLIPDVIFIDHNMPPIGGIEGIRLIRARQELQEVPLVLYSNSVTEKSSAEALRLGATACIQKPSCMADLNKRMQDFFTSLKNRCNR